jgi:hypothetical protein
MRLSMKSKWLFHFAAVLLGGSLPGIYPARAGVPEPDNLVYGTIAFNGRPVTLTNTDVRIEARRTPSGPAIATYHMGDSPLAGNFFYFLTLKLNSTPAASGTDSSVGDSLYFVVSDSTGVRDTRGFMISDWGSAARIDFGASIDTDGDGIPDGWEEIYVPGYVSGLTNVNAGPYFHFYVAGSNPLDPATYLTLSAQTVTTNLDVSFIARLASGIGFEGRTRYYSLQSSTNLTQGPWTTVSNFDAVLGANQTVVYSRPFQTNPPAYFRVRVWLQGP